MNNYDKLQHMNLLDLNISAGFTKIYVILYPNMCHLLAIPKQIIGISFILVFALERYYIPLDL